MVKNSLYSLKKNILNSKRLIQRLCSFALVLCASLQITYAANLTLSPTSVTTNVGKTFSIDLMVSDNIEAINAVASLISFPKDAIKVVSVSKKDSFISLWAEEPTFSNDDGTISLEGVALNPGFNKAKGKVLTISFKAVQAGNISITIKNGQVLANDGNATDVLKTTGVAFIYINEEGAVSTPRTESVVPVITSTTHPDSTKWYNSRDASFEWKLPEGITSVRTVYSDKETDNPSRVYTPAISTRSFTTDSDGIFFMAVQYRNINGWGPVSRFKFQVDTQAPEAVKASFPDGSVTTNQTPNILVQAEDSLSGISKITMSIDGGEPIVFNVDPSNLYRLPKQSAGKHTVVINALDGAGNASTVSLDYTIQMIAPPVITEYTKKVDFDHKFKVVGSTYPKSTVEVILVDEDGVLRSEKVTTDDTGLFTLLWDKSLESGVYEMKARVFDGKGSVSEFTENRVIIVERMILVRFGIFVMNWLSVILIIVIAVLMVLATLWYCLVQFARFRRRVKHNLKEVEDTLEVNVRGLRDDTLEFHDILVKAERKRELTREEVSILKRFKKRLEITEKEVEKKLEEAVE